MKPARKILSDINHIKKSNCCDAHLIPESDICSDCKEHAGHWLDAEPESGEMLCPECGKSIIPVKVEGGTFSPGEWAVCPGCDEIIDGPEFDKWVEAQNN